jgi:putative transposase
VTFGFIKAEKASFPISRMCRVLAASQSGFLAWQERPACRRQQQDMVHLAHIRTAFALSNGTYRSPRMRRDLVDEGHQIGRHRTARPMRENQLIERQKRCFKRTTDSEHAWPVAPNLVAPDFTAEGPDRKWGADISYIWTAEGWLYLAVVLDLHSRRVVGWAISDRLKRDLAVEAPRRALVARNPAPGVVHNSDRGSQYRSVDYQALLRKCGILISMSGRGNCYDNSMVLRRENSPLDCFLILLTFFNTITSQLIWPVAWQTRAGAENAVARNIDGFHNPVRRHSSLGFQSPIAFERRAREVSQTLSTNAGQVHDAI